MALVLRRILFSNLSYFPDMLGRKRISEVADCAALLKVLDRSCSLINPLA